MSRDPIEEAGGINLYKFVSNSPINRIDPWGLYDPDVPDYKSPVSGAAPVTDLTPHPGFDLPIDFGVTDPDQPWWDQFLFGPDYLVEGDPKYEGVASDFSPRGGLRVLRNSRCLPKWGKGTIASQASQNLKRAGLGDVKLAGQSFNSGRKQLENAGFRLDRITESGRRIFINDKTGATVTFDSGKALGYGQKPHWTIQDKAGQFLDRSGRPVSGPNPPMGGKHIPGG